MSDPLDIYSVGHLAALRATAAVLAVRPANRGRSRPAIRSAWEILPSAAPELTEWAAYFAAHSRKRAAAEAGIRGSVTPREAGDMIRNVTVFVRVVERLLRTNPKGDQGAV
nr:SAV_6107 family HEPN domain-containing protein [Streptomyces novaecaesareae]